MKRYILLLFMGFISTLNAQNIVLNVALCTQEQTNWCAAAASQCVLDYYGVTKSQCNIMEYVRSVSGNDYGFFNCCLEPSGACNRGVPLGVESEKGSIKGILMNFANIPCTGNKNTIWVTEIEDNLTLNRPIFAQVNLLDGSGDTHVVVIRGIEKENFIDYILFMDPAFPPTGGLRRLPYNDFMLNDKYWWRWTLEIQSCDDRDYPCHCYNLEWDGDETGLDCGGSCPPCSAPPPPPPTPNCSDCWKNYGEEGIDCGGEHCPPCADLPEEVVIDNINYYYSKEVMATKKITTKGSPIVGVWTTVSFITEEEGTITLLPDFRAVTGSNFRAYSKDLSEYSRACPDTLCSIAWVNDCVSTLYYDQYLAIHDLLYAVKIEYYIYDEDTQLIYSDVQKITRNGTFKLWDPKEPPSGKDSYCWIYCTIHYCNGTLGFLIKKFFVSKTKCEKSLPEEPEEPETPPQFSPPIINNISHQDEISPPSFSILPNPNSGTFQLETNFPLSDITHLKITNLFGVSVYEIQSLSSNTIHLPTSTTGLYFVIAYLKDGSVLREKIMIQK